MSRNATGTTVVEGVPSTVKAFMTVDDLAVLLQVSRRTVFRLRAKGTLPAPVEISTNIIRWRMADIRDYLASLPRRP